MTVAASIQIGFDHLAAVGITAFVIPDPLLHKIMILKRRQANHLYYQSELVTKNLLAILFWDLQNRVQQIRR